ncbi:MAG TPA: oxalate/formate MFS antiporter [Candidatus Limnocylindrales bacterium]|nr:oxalate/formate MFS antiporter [Candidatus Limnocylindrales bacterium]
MAATLSGTGRTRWVQLILGIIAMVMIANLQYGWTLFVNPIQDHFHWSKAAIQTTFTTFVFVETWLVPAEGYLIDRFGPRVITVVGGALVALSWVMFANAGSIWTFYVGAAIGGIGAGIVYGTTVGQALKWFPDKRGLAAGLTAAGFGAGSAMTIIPLANMITNSGYQQTFLVFGLIQGFFVIVIGFFLRAPREGEVTAVATSAQIHQTTRDFKPLEMLRTPLFWIMYLAMLCVAYGGVMATAQLAPIAKDYIVDDVPVKLLLFTLPAIQWALVLDRVLNGLARPTFGWISDRIGRENTMLLAFTLEGVIILGMIKVAANPLLFVLGSALLFFAYGEVFSLFPSLSADTWGRKYATTNYGFLYTSKGTAALLVPYANILKDATGSWLPIFQLAAALNIFAALLAFFVIKPMRARKRASEALKPVAAATAVIALLFAASSAPRPASAADTVNAEVASSVTAPFEQFIKLYEKRHPGTTVSAKYLGGQVIQSDVEADNPIDIVIVGKNQTDKLTAHINPPVAILTNREVILVPKGSTKIKSLKDLANPGVRVGLGNADSAVGTLARGVLKKAALDPAYGSDFPQKVRANTVFEGTSGVEVVNAVSSGKVDAAIAFVSDVDPSKFSGVKIPDNLNVDSVYYVFVPKGAKNAAAGNEIMKLVSSKQGAAILHSYRFLPPPKS